MSYIIGRCCAIPVLAAGIVLLAADPGRAEQLRDAKRHFTLEVPAGWELMPQDVVAAANASGPEWMRKRSGRYIAGIRRESDARPGSPIILIQFEPEILRGESFEELERRWAHDFEKVVRIANGKLSDLGRQLSDQTLVFDRAARWFVLRGRMNAGPVTAAVYGIGFLSKEGVVLFQCIALQDELEQWRTAFDGIGESLQFDAGYEFDARPVESFGGMFAVVGAAAVIAVAALVKLTRRRRPGEGPVTT